MRDKPDPAFMTRAAFALLATLVLCIGCAPKDGVRPDAAPAEPLPAAAPARPEPPEPTAPRGDALKAPPETSVDPERVPVLSVFFDFQSERIDPRFLDSLRGLADQAKADDDLWIILEGHTDSRGSREFNMALAQRRAVQVQKHLVELGVKATRIRVHTYGEERSSDETDSARRVDVLLRRSRR
jgi:outer membrane protein OmpA-like peptidoglycan-associated protein